MKSDIAPRGRGSPRLPAPGASHPPSPVRVLMTADCVGGVFGYALELARALRRFQVHVGLALMGPTPSLTQRRTLAELENVELFESRFKLEWMDEPWREVREAGDWLLGLEREFRPDVVHLNGYCHGALPFRAPVLIVGHSCVLSWWQAVKGEPAPERYARYREEVRRGLAGADCVVAPSRAMLAALQTNYRRLASARVIYNGRDPAQFAPGEKRNSVLFAGRIWDDAKNARALLAAAAKLEAPVLVAGATRQQLRTFGNVRFLGELSHADLAAHYAAAAIYCLPAKYEPFGLSALEAALSGCALVLGDIPSLREIWGEAAMFVSPDDEAMLAAALNELLNDRSMRQACAARAQARALKYTPEPMAAAYFDVYQRLLAASERGEYACAS
jgi:glycogen(starch) synthase